MKNYNEGTELFKIKVLRTPIQNNPQGINLIVLRPDFYVEQNLNSYGLITVKSGKGKQKEKTFFCFNNEETYKWVKACAFFQNISVDKVCTNLMNRYIKLSFNAEVIRPEMLFE
jgi:hypothetical protein